MEYIVNQDAIKKYAAQLTEKLCRQFFINKAFISGPEILSFHEENQLNLLIVKNIYLNWQKETAKLKSPYFDFEDEEVKQALRVFMNRLSNHIKVYRYDFEPLVSKSIAEFILLAAAPIEFFTAEIEALAGPKISISLLKEFSRYIRVNRFIIDQIIREIETAGYSETFAGETIRYMRKSVLENPEKLDTPADVLIRILQNSHAELTDFVSVPKPLVSKPSFLEGGSAQASGVLSVPAGISETIIPKSENNSDSSLKDDEDILENGEPLEEEEIPILITNEEIPPVFMEDEDSGSLDVSDEAESGQQEDAESRSADSQRLKIFAEEEEVAALNFSLDQNRESIREFSGETEQKTRLQKEEAAEIMERIDYQAVPFRTLVPMHYRFTFINSLFDGNQDAWADAVEKIDATRSLDEAAEMLAREYADKFNWAQKEDNVAILLNYVERKF